MAAHESLSEQFAAVSRGERKDIWTPHVSIGLISPFTDKQGRPSYVVHRLVTHVDRRGPEAAGPLLDFGRALLRHADEEGRWIHTSAASPKLVRFYKTVGGFKEGGEGAYGTDKEIPLLRRPRGPA